MEKQSRYKLYVFLNGAPIQGPYRKEEISEYFDMLDDLFLSGDYPLSHVSLIEHINNTDNPFWYCYTAEGYLNFKETYLANKPKILTKEMKKCNTKYGEEAEKQRYMNS